MTATIVTVGEELLIGQVVDTNAAWLSNRLYWLGVRVRKVVTVGDEDRAIQKALGQEWPKSDIVLVTGGLGPTPDDLTREAVAKFFRRSLIRDVELLAELEADFGSRGREMPPSCTRMAMIPSGFQALYNPTGVAPGLMYEDTGQRMLFVMPGVPEEMKAIFSKSIEPIISKKGVEHTTVHRTLCTAGESETSLAARLGDLTKKHRIAFLPRVGQVRLRLSSSSIHAQKKLDVLEVLIRTRLGNCVFGTGEDTLEWSVGQALKKRHCTIAVAESCSGGHALDMLTDVPGSSEYVRGGVIAYSNAIKTNALGVQSATIQIHGAVSKAVALEMAHGVREKLGADVGLAVTGIAGPGGGTDKKPVGTVWVGYADREGAEAQRYLLSTERKRNKVWSAVLALDLVRRKMLDKSP